MNFLQTLWSEWQQMALPRRQTVRKNAVRRGRKTLQPVEPLEIRTLLAGEFTELTATGLPPMTGEMSWGDMDNDGDLDVLATGTGASSVTLSRIYKNNGNGTFSDINAGLPRVSGGSAWADTDNDGDLDLVLSGFDSTSTRVTKLFRNDSAGQTFTEVPDAGFVGLSNTVFSWGDMDNDGDLDLAVGGFNAAGTRTTKVYRNDGGNAFTDTNASLVQVSAFPHGLAWGDSDRDGDLDLLVSGFDGTVAVTKLYINDGSGELTAITTSMADLLNSSVSWGDYNQDGKLDVAIAGNDGPGNPFAKIYRNEGNNTFTDINAGLTGLYVGDVSWGDLNNDGKLDLAVSGSDASGVYKSIVYLNNGDQTFTELSAGLTGTVLGVAGWGDMNGDGKLDLLINGRDANGILVKVYQNNTTVLNNLPNVPTGLTTTSSSSTSLTFSWTAPTDVETASLGLSYNLRVGTTPGGSDVFSTMANTTSGLRRIPSAGPIQGTSFTLKGVDLTTKSYYWSVQAVDASFAGSPFATEQIFTTAPVVDLGSLGLNDIIGGSVAWGDMDSDGDLDILLTGRDNGNNRFSKVYRNNGNSTFTDLNAGLPGVFRSSAAWGDMDSDGDLDILLTGQDSTNALISKVYQNNGNSTFTDLNAGLPGVYRSSAAWGDMDNDGDLDVLLTGIDSADTPISKVYRNNGNSTFTDINAGLAGVHYSSVAWGDMDNDGDLDILLTGNDTGFNSISKVYRNNGNSTFTDLNAGLAGVRFGSVAWGDSDNDGDLDILLSGKLSDGDRTAKVYRNSGNSTFTDLNAGLNGVDSSSVAWGDMDYDGDLDILLTGYADNFDDVTKIYRNNATTANTAPNVPTNLNATVPTSTSMTFSWTAPTDAQTTALGLSYNLRVGTTPGAGNVFSTMSDTDANAGNGPNGRRRVADSGPIQGTSYTLKNLTPGTTYFWSVQAIDTAFTGSAFAAEQSKLLPAVNTAPTIGGAVANQAVNDNATIQPFNTLTITDPDTNAMTASVTILNGVVRGDFTTATTNGWTRAVVNTNDIRYSRTYPSAANIGATVQSAIRGFVFRPRENFLEPNKQFKNKETTAFRVTVSDGIAAPVSNETTSVITTSVNNAPTISGAMTNITVNDNATVNPFPNLTVSDVDTQEMLISVTILNGVVRGDFTNATVANGWAVRQVLGNNITYKRYFSPQANVGAAAQAAFRALIFQPRQNAITPGTTELTDFQVTVSDGVAPAVLGAPNTRVTTTSVNDLPVIGGAAANQTMNDNQTKAVLNTLTVTDPDTQNMNVIITITNGVNRGDFTVASRAGWTRTVSGNDLRYSRFFSPAANIGNVVQAAIRVLVFQPRTNVPIGTTETTTFTVFVNDGLANSTNSTTSVITTGVAPRPAPSPVTPSLFLDRDIVTVVLPTVAKANTGSLAKWLRKTR